MECRDPTLSRRQCPADATTPAVGTAYVSVPAFTTHATAHLDDTDYDGDESDDDGHAPEPHNEDDDAPGFVGAQPHLALCHDASSRSLHSRDLPALWGDDGVFDSTLHPLVTCSDSSSDSSFESIACLRV